MLYHWKKPIITVNLKDNQFVMLFEYVDRAEQWSIVSNVSSAAHISRRRWVFSSGSCSLFSSYKSWAETRCVMRSWNGDSNFCPSFFQTFYTSIFSALSAPLTPNWVDVGSQFSQRFWQIPHPSPHTKNRCFVWKFHQHAVNALPPSAKRWERGRQPRLV